MLKKINSIELVEEYCAMKHGARKLDHFALEEEQTVINRNGPHKYCIVYVCPFERNNR